MAISMDLRVLARKLEKSSDDLLISASQKSPDVFEKVAMAIASASTLLEGVADDMDNHASFEMTPQQLDEIAALASAFDESGDPLLQKQASVLDEILLSIAAPKNAAATANKATQDEINRLRDERRKSLNKACYTEARERLHMMENHENVAKAVEQQVKRFVPLEAPLQTRYPPDRPGGQMTRITDGVYQDIVTGIIYDYKSGYKTQKGNEVPGGSVENQTRDLGDTRLQGTSLFETRDSLMGRYAGKDAALIKKIATALKSVRDHAPGLLDRAIDSAMDAGLSTSQVGEILASDISEEGLKVIADEESEKKKSLAALPSNIDFIEYKELTPRESLREYENARPVLKALSEVAAADPAHKASWLRMIEDNLKVLRSLGVNENHLTLLTSEFLGSEAESILGKTQRKATIAPPNKVVVRQDQDGEEFEEAPTLHAETVRQSLIALAINAIQELAPHLLKPAIAKAKAAGLKDSQIKSLLTANFNIQLEKPSDEIKVAESIFPHLKDLGWNDLIRKHIKVMAGFGIDQQNLQKIADRYGPADAKSLRLLGRVLKTAGVTEFTPEQLGEPAAQAPIQVPIEEDFEDEPVGRKQKLTAAELPALAKNVVETIRSGLANPSEYQKLKLRYQGQELIERAAYYEAQKFRNEMNVEMFSEFANLVNEWAKAELLPTMTQAPVETKKPIPKLTFTPKVRQKAVPTLIGPEENLAGWLAAYDEAFDKVNIPEFVEKIQEASDDTDEQENMFYAALDKVMRDNGFIGSHEIHSSGRTYFDIAEELDAAEKRKVTYGPFNPKAKEPEIAKLKDESQQAYEERKAKSKVRGPTKEQLELGDIGKKEEPELSDKKPAENSTKYKYLKWGDYQKQWDVFVSEKQAKELEEKIADKISIDRDQLEEAFKNFVYDIDKTPESITSLPDDVRGQVMDMLGRGESSRAVSSYLTKKNMERHGKAEPFAVPSFNDIKAARFLTLGKQKEKELKEYRNEMLKRIIKRNVRDVLVEAGFDPNQPMFEPGENDDISYNQVNNDLKMIMGEEKAKAPFFRKIPIGPEGTRLIPFWEKPAEYWRAFVAAKNHFEGWDDEARHGQDDYMVSKGFVSPDEPLFGYQTSRQLLRNIDPNVTGNILPNFKDPETGEQFKTLFSDPEEYRKAFVEAKGLFSNQWREKPREWHEITGSEKFDISDVPLIIKRKLLPLAMKGVPRKQLEEIGQSMGADANTVKRVREYASQSGDKIRGTIMALAFSGVPFEEAKGQLEERFPDAKIPWPTVEFVFNNLQADKADTAESQQEQNKWMAAKGFYPPYQIAVGGIGIDKERRQGKFPKREEPVTFASILSPRKGKGMRDSGASGEASSLSELKEHLREPQKGRISKPKWTPSSAQRQPGTSGTSVRSLSPFAKKK